MILVTTSFLYSVCCVPSSKSSSSLLQNESCDSMMMLHHPFIFKKIHRQSMILLQWWVLSIIMNRSLVSFRSYEAARSKISILVRSLLWILLKRENLRSSLLTAVLIWFWPNPVFRVMVMVVVRKQPFVKTCFRYYFSLCHSNSIIAKLISYNSTGWNQPM